MKAKSTPRESNIPTRSPRPLLPLSHRRPTLNRNPNPNPNLTLNPAHEPTCKPNVTDPSRCLPRPGGRHRSGPQSGRDVPPGRPRPATAGRSGATSLLAFPKAFTLDDAKPRSVPLSRDGDVPAGRPYLDPSRSPRPILALFLLLTCLFRAFAADTVQVTLGPQEALQAGAKWKFTIDAQWRESGVIYSNLPSGTYTIVYSPVPGWSQPKSVPDVVIQNLPNTQVRHGVNVSYRRVPARTLRIHALGGEVVGDAWPAMAIFDWVQLNSTDSGRWEFFKARSLRARAYPLTEQDFAMPMDNQDYGVHLMALARPGFQFMGWTGTHQTTRNPITVHLTSDHDLSAVFTSVSTNSATASLLAGEVSSDGTLLAHAQFSYPLTNALSHLVWNFALPAGWKVEAAFGLGQPKVSDGAVHIGADNGPSLPTTQNPLQFNIVLRVPEGATGSQVLSSSVSYQVSNSPTHKTAQPNSITVETTFQPPVSLTLLNDSAPDLLRLDVAGRPGETVTVQSMDAIQNTPRLNWSFFKVVTLTNASQAGSGRVLLPATDPQRFYRAVRIQ